jgi:hypothetical protein
MMLLACLFCRGPMTQISTVNDRRITITEEFKKIDDSLVYDRIRTISLHGFLCRHCGWYTEIQSSHIMDRDGTIGFKNTGD